MSSIVGHATAGFTVFLCCRDAHSSSKRMAVIYVVLAICADLDYLAIWGLGYAAHPRVTHSILFALAAPVLARIALRSRDASTAPIAGLLIASLSHPRPGSARWRARRTHAVALAVGGIVSHWRAPQRRRA